MTKTKLFSALAIAGVCAMGTQAAFAYGSGDIFARAGYAKTDADTGYFADKDSNAYLGLGYMFHDNLGVEVSSMLETKLHAEGGTAKQVPINLTAQYYPMGALDSKVQPYVGVGVNYTTFNDDKSIGSIKDSWGATGLVGVDLSVTDYFGFNAFAQYSDVKADINGGKSLDVDPVTVGAGIQARF